jgi:hypothetical protein
MMTCPKCSQPAIPDRAVIADETVYECKKCDLYTVEGSAKWVRGGPFLVGTLRFLAESRDGRSGLGS